MNTNKMNNSLDSDSEDSETVTFKYQSGVPPDNLKNTGTCDTNQTHSFFLTQQSQFNPPLHRKSVGQGIPTSQNDTSLPPPLQDITPSPIHVTTSPPQQATTPSLIQVNSPLQSTPPPQWNPPTPPRQNYFTSDLSYNRPMFQSPPPTAPTHTFTLEDIATLLKGLKNELNDNQNTLESKIQEKLIDNQKALTDKMTENQNTIEQKLSGNETQLNQLQTALETMSLECRERSDKLEAQIKENRETILGLELRTQNFEYDLQTSKTQLDQLQTQLENIRLVESNKEAELEKKINETIWLNFEHIKQWQDKQKPTTPKETQNNPNLNTIDTRQTTTTNRPPTNWSSTDNSENESSDSVNSQRPRTKKRRTNNLRIREPVFFNNSQQTAPEFIKEMNNYYKMTGVMEDSDKITNFPQFLRGNSAKWCRIQLADTISWENLCRKFISQYFNKKEIAQEWEGLDYKNFTNDCEGFVIKAWQLQSTLHQDYDTAKKCANITRKLPTYLQVKVKERIHHDFDEFLRNVKEIEKSNYYRFKETPKRYYNKDNSTDKQTNRTPPRSPQKSPQTYYNRNYQNNHQKQDYHDRRPAIKKYNNRNRYFSSRNSNRRPPYRNDSNNRDNRPNKYNREIKETIGALTLIPIDGQPGSYTILKGKENLPSPPKSPSSPRRGRDSRANSPQTNNGSSTPT